MQSLRGVILNAAAFQAKRRISQCTFVRNAIWEKQARHVPELARDSGTSRHRTGPGNAAEVGADARSDSLSAAYLSTSQTVKSCSSECFLWSTITNETGTALSSRGPAVVSVQLCETPPDRAHIP